MADRLYDHLSELAVRVKRGDVGAFEQLFRECHAPLCEVVDSYVRSQAIAEEIVQDLFFVLCAKRLAIWEQWLDTTLLAPVPHRQVVLKIPKRLRAYCLYLQVRLPMNPVGRQEILDFLRAKLLCLNTISRRPCPDAGMSSRASSVSKRG